MHLKILKIANPLLREGLLSATCSKFLSPDRNKTNMGEGGVGVKGR